MKRVLNSPQKFLLTPAPGWQDITLHELNSLLAIPWASYPLTPLLNSNSFYSKNYSSNIYLSNCSYRQMIELATRLVSIHDIDWILFSKKCQNHSQLFSSLASLSSHELFSTSSSLSTSTSSDFHLNPIKIISYSNKSFLNSSSHLKNSFQKLFPFFHFQNSSSEIHSNDLTTTPVNRIKIFLIENVLTVTLSLGGNNHPLWKRGYKFHSFERTEEDENQQVISEKRLAVAPLAEHHAAACFLWMVISNYRDLYSIKDSSEAIDREKYQSFMKRIGQIIVPFAGSGELSPSMSYLCVISR